VDNEYSCGISTLMFSCSALKIQCSSSTFYLLEEIGGYLLDCRGMMQVKVSPGHWDTGETGGAGAVGGMGHWRLPRHCGPVSIGQRGHGDLLVGGQEDVCGPGRPARPLKRTRVCLHRVRSKQQNPASWRAFINIFTLPWRQPMERVTFIMWWDVN